MSWRWILVLAVISALLLVGAAALLFQDNITRFNLNPRTPYQTYTPPPAPDYREPAAWALWPADRTAGAADVFYVHSTTYSSSEHWNAPLSDREAEATLQRVAAPNEAGPFMRVGALFAPRYRQATLYATFTHNFDGLSARELSFRDVERAFHAFLAQGAADRPMILVGYGQGGLHVLGLLQTIVAKSEDARARLAAAYIIGEATPLRVFDDALADIPLCEDPQATGCVVSYIDLETQFDDERRRFKKRSLIWDENKRLVSLNDEPILCINPLSWTASEAPVDASRHIGAASETGLRMSETPPAISRAIGAQCADGVLIVDQPSQNFLRRRHWFGAHWRPQTFNLFYHDLAADAERRAAILTPILIERARLLDPISDPVDLGVSPVNKVPE